jgi:hypothetical protein
MWSNAWAASIRPALDGALDPTTFSDAMKLEYDQIQQDIAAPRSESPPAGPTRMARLDAALLLARRLRRGAHRPGGGDAIFAV